MNETRTIHEKIQFEDKIAIDLISLDESTYPDTISLFRLQDLGQHQLICRLLSRMTFDKQEILLESDQVAACLFNADCQRRNLRVRT